MLDAAGCHSWQHQPGLLSDEPGGRGVAQVTPGLARWLLNRHRPCGSGNPQSSLAGALNSAAGLADRTCELTCRAATPVHPGLLSYRLVAEPRLAFEADVPQVRGDGPVAGGLHQDHIPITARE